MKYKVFFSVTDTYPEVEIEAEDREEAVRLYKEMWMKGLLSEYAIQKDARYSAVSLWKPKAK
jgi:hypothetical protein